MRIADFVALLILAFAVFSLLTQKKPKAFVCVYVCTRREGVCLEGC